jgi:hypothetical protein
MTNKKAFNIRGRAHFTHNMKKRTWQEEAGLDSKQHEELLRVLKRRGLCISKRIADCTCDEARPGLAQGREYEKDLVCLRCAKRCPCCNDHYTSEYQCDDGPHSSVCSGCAHGDNGPCLHEKGSDEDEEEEEQCECAM